MALLGAVAVVVLTAAPAAPEFALQSNGSNIRMSQHIAVCDCKLGGIKTGQHGRDGTAD